MSTLKRTLLVFLLLAAACALSASPLPEAFTARGNPRLYKKLRSQAMDNLRRLDQPEKGEYRRLLREQDDALMAYLIAYESDAKLQAADPADVLDNYLQIRAYLNRYGTPHDPEFFLAYVADQTVSDERIQAYRSALLKDGLREILQKSPNELELYRAVSQWCVARLKFQPTSGRDQSPLDITQKSLLGRCEEMQILFVAAARTVGLPSRAASTPWWPHMDNNHAWAEVWLNGAWHYTGDMDAAYYADQTWFSGLVDKTVLIIADGTLPAPQDEVLSRGSSECVINSTRNYARERTRTLHIHTRDLAGKPLSGTDIGIMVYNWNSLRPLAYVKTDAKGNFVLSVGRGAFYLSAFRDGKKALQLIPSGNQKELDCVLVLKDAPLADQNAFLEYPANPFEWKQAPPEWNAGVTAAKARWNEQDQSFALWKSAHPDSLLGNLNSLARGNAVELRRFLRRNPNPDSEFLAFAGSPEPQYLDPKLLWQADADLLEAVYNQYLRYRNSGLDWEELASVVSPAVYYEDLPRAVEFSRGKAHLYPPEFFKKGKTRLERLERAALWLRRNYSVDARKALQGLLPLDVASRRELLSPVQYRTLAVNLARANGIPAEFSRQPNLVWVQYDNGQWGYFDLKKCAPEADPADAKAFSRLTVRALDDYGVPLSGRQDNLMLCRYSDGSFYWLDQGFSPAGDGLYSISVPNGEYYLQLGYRVSESKTAFQMRHLEFTGADSLYLELALPEFPRNWEPASEELLSLLDDVEAGGIECVLIGSHDQENSLRIAEKLHAEGIPFLWLGYERDVLFPPQNYAYAPAWSRMVSQNESNRLRTYTLLRRDGRWQSYEGLWSSLPK